ncbi:response regulator transcription factor [Thalassotalea crassostreae]|uniref:response regulator transcription factor n=1 Tax=Thalassotalea crassostreae TaxID=1763536 RepID=UPI0008399C64|nr:response regulator transcription factor [Thalassotalea crassostreae]
MDVLIVEDNFNIAESIGDYLLLYDVMVDFAYNGESALELVADNSYDVIVMDIMMPKLDGIRTVSHIRQVLQCNTPIIFLTAKDTIEDKLTAFKSGGDDYLVKPFSLDELYVRLLALSSRGGRTDIGKLTYKDLEFDVQTGELTRDGNPIKLSNLQLKIVSELMRSAPNIVSKSKLSSAVWGDDSPDTDALRSHMYVIRNAIDKKFTENRVETVHGKGYRIQ